MKLTFEEESHTYKLDGAIVPSVTQILSAERFYDPSKYSAGSAQFGTDVHAACELWDVYKEETGDERIKPYLKAWRGFCEQKAVKFTEIEESHFHETHRYAGTIDRLGTIGENRVLIDIKSGGKEPWHPIQTAGYAWMMEKPLLLERMCVYLRNDATYSIEFHTRAKFQDDIGVFLAALCLQNWRLRNNGKRT